MTVSNWHVVAGSVLCLAALVMGGVRSAGAAELTILSGGAAKAGLGEAIPLYEKATGQKVVADYAPMGPLMRRLGEGNAPDLVVVTTDVVGEVEKRGHIVASSVTEIGRVGIGVAVHESAPSPDTSTPEALKKALLDARSLVYINPATGTSGRHFAQVLQTLGIAEAVKAKTTLGEGGYVVEPVGRKEIELGVHQISEILPVKGIKLVGPLPAELQKVTVYVGAVTTKARDGAQARQFLAFMQTPEVRKAFAAKGYAAAP